MVKINKRNQMLLFCRNTGLSIKYDEYKNDFQFHKLPVHRDITQFYAYAYVCINGIVLFFGGWNGEYGTNDIILKSVHKYSIQENMWTTFEHTLTSPLHHCFAIFNENNYIHIIGGEGENVTVSTHVKTKVRVWDSKSLVIICLFILMKHK
ncbi:hypothetical protein RFI_25974 [Reticulomyxa filosa]|uniref:Kelch motif family protein n=1 Tax=Reticulomyxa filosa TaxID=46433 RepID=X6MDB6_RETFI|nr:hypothetical protein RFI_25974 [Reticulomyxa filosa]|eukprot:ETO11402.1 hypothetical protein RFI_25974 [Reticulomyxa filosa]